MTLVTQTQTRTQAQAQAQAQAGAGADAAHVEALVGPPLQPAEWEDAALAEGRLLFMLIRSLQEACPQLPLRPAQLRPPDDAGRAAYARAHAFFEECVSEVEVCWLGRAQLVHFAPPMAASHLPPSFEEELLRALLRHATPQQRAAELLLQQARGSPLTLAIEAAPPSDRGCNPMRPDCNPGHPACNPCAGRRVDAHGAPAVAGDARAARARHAGAAAAASRLRAQRAAHQRAAARRAAPRRIRLARLGLPG